MTHTFWWVVGLLISTSLLMGNDGTTAVVVGIADFEDPAIADLRFADRDAEAFATFLTTPAAGGLPSDRIRLMTNRAATLAAIQAALRWQLERSRAGGTAFLYLATHGDVEADDLATGGYLLAHDTPYNNYNLLALGVDYLNDHLAALARKGVQAVMITDACHSGTLAGNAVAGRRLTAARLMAARASEIRLLSCQPYELSYEGERWGEGRGVFSYHLVRALAGAADEDRNRRVDLYELERFVQDRVSEDTEREQHPAFVGGRKDGSLLAGTILPRTDYLEERSRNVEASFEETQLALAPPDAQRDYLRFQRALAGGNLWNAEAGPSARTYYRRLRGAPELLPLRGLLDERFTVALLDSVQQAIQNYLDAEADELMQRERLDEKYLDFPAYLARAAAILGEADPRYRGIEAKRYYFEGLILRLRTNFTNRTDSLLAAAEDRLTEAVALAPEAAYMHNELGIVRQYRDRDSLARLSYERARALAPTWALPHSNLSSLLRKMDLEDMDATIIAGYERAIALRPDLGVAYMSYGNFCRARGRRDSAIMLLRRAVAASSSLIEARYNLANLLVDDPATLPEAIDHYRFAMAKRPLMTKVYYGLGYAFEETERYDSAAAYYTRGLKVPEGGLREYLYAGLARVYQAYDPEAGRRYFRELMRTAPDRPYGYALTAVLDPEDGDWRRALRRSDLPEDEHFDLITAVAVELYQQDESLELPIRAATLGVRAYPQLTAAYRNLTDLFLLGDRLPEARRTVEKALNVARKNGDAADLCAHIRGVSYYEPLLADPSAHALFAEHCPEDKTVDAHEE